MKVYAQTTTDFPSVFYTGASTTKVTNENLGYVALLGFGIILAEFIVLKGILRMKSGIWKNRVELLMKFLLGGTIFFFAILSILLSIIHFLY